MLESLPDVPQPLLAVRASGRVERRDCEQVLAPALERATQEGRKLRLLFELGSDLEGTSLGAALMEARLATRYAASFERCAIVGGTRAAKGLAAGAASLLPVSARVFDASERADAVAWLCEPLVGQGLALFIRPDQHVLILRPYAPLGAEDAMLLERTLDSLVTTAGTTCGIVIHAQEFPSFRDPGGLMRHLRSLRGPQQHVQRLAFATDSPLAGYAAGLMRRFVTPLVRAFDYRELDAAVCWAAGDAAANGEGLHGAEIELSARDRVDQAGLESFPASDPPPNTPVS